MSTLKKIILIIISIVMLGFTIKCALADVTQNFTINASNSSDYVLTNINISLQENATVFINDVTNETKINSTYPSSVFFGNATEVIINFTFKPAVEFNKSDNIGLVFNISNDVNNNSFFYIVELHINIDEINYTELISHHFISVIEGNYEINYTTDLLPTTGQLKYEIGGVVNDTLNITCSEGYLDCPINSTFGSDNKTTFYVNYSLPILSNQTITYDVNLTTYNVSKHTTVTFIITEPGILFKRYEWRDECFIERDGVITVTYDCILEYEEYNIRRLRDYLDRLSEMRNETITCGEPETITEYVYSGSLQESVYQDYTDCKIDRSNINDELDTCRSDYSECLLNLSDSNNNWLERNTKIVQEMLSAQTRHDKETKDTEHKAFWTIFWVVLIVIICVILFFVIRFAIIHMKKDRWCKQNE